MKKLLFLAVTLLLINSVAMAQSAKTPILGFGLGLEYGGIGGQAGYQIDDQIGAFVGFGTAFASTGYNVGIKYILKGKSSTEQFFLEALYGYNAVILVDLPSGDKIRDIYYGPSFGGGINIHNKKGKSFWHLALLIPIRSSEYRTAWDLIQNDPDLTTFSLPFTFSVGLNFKL